MMSSTVDISIIILFNRKDEKFQQAIESARFAKEIITVQNSKITDFSKVRNQALKGATQKWVFFLDSDEIISPSAVPKIKKIIAVDLFDGATVEREDVFYNRIIRHGEAGDTTLLRMGKRERMRWERPVHEVAKINGVIKKSNIKIIHQSHSSLSDFVASVINYAEMEAKYRISIHKTPSILQLIIFPIIKFIHNYLGKRGFLDGWRGMSYALIMSLHSFSVRIFQYELRYQKT